MSFLWSAWRPHKLVPIEVATNQFPERWRPTGSQRGGLQFVLYGTIAGLHINSQPAPDWACFLGMAEVSLWGSLGRRCPGSKFMYQIP